MARQTQNEPKAIVLRTAAEVCQNCLLALELLGEEWPKYQPDIINCRVFFHQIVEDAKQYGYVGRGR